MFVKTLAIAAASVGVVSATCGAYPPALNLQSQNSPLFNAVSRPDGSNPATLGQAGNIVWDATGWGQTVTIYLLRGPGDNIQLQSTLATSAPNTGTFSWTPDCSLTPDTTHWGLMIQDNDSCTFQWSTQFGINPDTAGVCSGKSSTSAPPASSTAPPKSSETAPPPKSETISHPPKGSDGPSGPGGHPSGGVPYPSGKNNCTSTSTVWVNPTGTGSYTPPKNSYVPAQSNDGARYGISLFGALAVAAAAAFSL